MRETRIAQRSIFDTYSEHDIGVQLKNLSDLLDGHPEYWATISLAGRRQILWPVGLSFYCRGNLGVRTKCQVQLTINN